VQSEKIMDELSNFDSLGLYMRRGEGVRRKKKLLAGGDSGKGLPVSLDRIADDKEKTTMIDFKTKFKALTEYAPFPWQIKLFEEWFAEGRFPHSCNLATGLGKTSVIAIWLIALMDQPDKVPRRLVYIVNRRTVVDQTTEEVMKIRKNLSKLEGAPKHVQQLAISTLRGQFADNHEWSADPSRPAVICGTVDMIGSRLLFSGYGVGFKAKPLHAGFLGQDVLVVHDEAHLEPAFQELLTAIEKAQLQDERSLPMPWLKKLRVMELTATSRWNGAERQKEKPFVLTEEERNPPEVIPDPPTEPIHHVWLRQKAKKTIYLHTNEDDSKLADQIARLALAHKDSGQAVLVFLRTVEDVERVSSKLPKEATERLTGTLRGLERDALVKKSVFQRFLSESDRSDKVVPASGTVYLICTSAGEVGVNISADHLVCDLSTFESMAQRFGRVNRFGKRRDTRIDILPPQQFGKKDKNGKLTVDELDQRRQKTLELLKRLDGDASPAALGKLDPNDCLAAFAPSPIILPVTDILLDAWALTTIREKLPGRPVVEPYLHGVSEWQPPETYVAWRQEVWELRRELADERDREQFQEFVAELLEDYPLKSHELLRDSTSRKDSGIQDKLAKLAEKHGDLQVWVQEPNGTLLVTQLSKVADLQFANRTVILPPEAGGLSIADGQSAGLFDGSDYLPEYRNVYDVADLWIDDKGPLRKRVWQGEDDPIAMTLEREIRIENPEDEDIESPKVWRWFVRKPEVANERSQIAYPLQLHLNEVKWWAAQVVGRLMDADSEIARAVILAAWCHDLGKRRERWQRSLGNDDYPNEVYAKSGSRNGRPPLRPRDFLRNDYRHEFGSVLDLCDESQPYYAEFIMMGPEMQDLVLHLIAAHHGRARPHFPPEEAEDDEHIQAAAKLAIETPQRFARLQQRYGRWGLAYLESLVRAADYTASANPNTAVKEEQL
jgi:CRISPR-associated endonuclease/helicase Cas3